MKLCTFNIWNSNTDFNSRMNLLSKLIKENEIDILALQEVRDESIVKKLADNCGYKFYNFSNYTNYGLAILSKFPIRDIKTNFESASVHNSLVQRCIVSINDFEVGVTNVHLDYASEENRLLGLDEALDLIENNTNIFEVLLGDFNVDSESNIHFELRMDEFVDIYQSYCFKRNIFPEPTLDFNNPRWKNEEINQTPGRFDWIFVHTSNDYKIVHSELIGKDETNGITPSDHYGVVAEIKLP
ncbi:endonuclease/exonuclease/phosphatase family protein [Mycoplasmatota bacterium]|nr:endonuclease/exonuclease/phosphatase family protein [Mycoplasmatota bacterium]